MKPQPFCLWHGRVSRREIEAPDATPNGVHVDQVAISAESVLDIGSGKRIRRGFGGDRLVDAVRNSGKVALSGASCQRIFLAHGGGRQRSGWAYNHQSVGLIFACVHIVDVAQGAGATIGRSPTVAGDRKCGMRKSEAYGLKVTTTEPLTEWNLGSYFGGCGPRREMTGKMIGIGLFVQNAPGCRAPWQHENRKIWVVGSENHGRLVARDIRAL